MVTIGPEGIAAAATPECIAKATGPEHIMSATISHCNGSAITLKTIRIAPVSHNNIAAIVHDVCTISRQGHIDTLIVDMISIHQCLIHSIIGEPYDIIQTKHGILFIVYGKVAGRWQNDIIAIISFIAISIAQSGTVEPDQGCVGRG